MSTETPRTIACDLLSPSGEEAINEDYNRMYEHAAQLETELATERAKVEELKGQREHWRLSSVCRQSVAERDRALAEVARLRGALEEIHDMAGYPRECATDLIGKEFAEAELRERIVSEAHKALSTPSPTSNEEALSKCAERMAEAGEEFLGSCMTAFHSRECKDCEATVNMMRQALADYRALSSQPNQP